MWNLSPVAVICCVTRSIQWFHPIDSQLIHESDCKRQLLPPVQSEVEGIRIRGSKDEVKDSRMIVKWKHTRAGSWPSHGVGSRREALENAPATVYSMSTRLQTR